FRRGDAAAHDPEGGTAGVLGDPDDVVRLDLRRPKILDLVGVVDDLELADGRLTLAEHHAGGEDRHVRTVGGDFPERYLVGEVGSPGSGAAALADLDGQRH